jgi:hypothetical protein
LEFSNTDYANKFRRKTTQGVSTETGKLRFAWWMVCMDRGVWAKCDGGANAMKHGGIFVVLYG